MTAPLHEKARDVALAAWFANTAQGWPAAMDAAISAYLAASPSPSMEMEVVAWQHPTAGWARTKYHSVLVHCHKSGPTPIALVRQDQAQSALAAMRAERDEATRRGEGQWAGWVKEEVRRKEAEAQVLRLTEENEALIGARNENAKLKGQRDAALARIKALEEALRPFAKCSEVYPDSDPSAEAGFANLHDPRCPLTIADYHAARSALGGNAL